MYKIIGITTMTESAAVFMENGEVKHAVEEERFSRIKHSGGIPYKSIDFILNEEKISLNEIDCLAVYWNPYLLPERTLIFVSNVLANFKSIKTKILRALNVFQGYSDIDSGWIDILLIKYRLKKKYGTLPKKIEFHDHHLSHVASAFYANDYKNSNVLVMDGAGEVDATSIAIAKDNEISFLKKIKLPNSLGHYYSSFTGFLGFKMLDGEYKLMGLAPYGQPIYRDWIKQNILIPSNEFFYSLNYKNLDYHDALVGRFSKNLLDKFGKPNLNTFKEIDKKYLDLASSVQVTFEEIVYEIIKYIKKNSDLENLSIVGGCGLNCKANGYILSKNIFKNIYVPPVPNDPGGALGASYLSNKNNSNYRNKKLNNAFLGYEIQNKNIEANIKKYALNSLKLNSEELIKNAVNDLIAGEVIAWVQGKMEFGPRALGNRSFLADPRKENIIEKLNIKIKKREKFRPFAPSVLDEFKDRFFDLNQRSDYMSFIVNVKAEARELVPAIVHYDGSARPQTVIKNQNRLYWDLIYEFYKKTNVPMLLNTSFNINEPIACTENDSFETFLKSDITKLYIGEYIVSK